MYSQSDPVFVVSLLLVFHSVSLRLRGYCRFGNDFRRQLFHIELVRLERFVQFRQPVRTVCQHRLFYQIMK